MNGNRKKKHSPNVYNVETFIYMVYFNLNTTKLRDSVLLLNLFQHGQIKNCNSYILF